LRRRYNNSYSEYLSAFHKLVTLRDKIDGILRSNEGNNAGSISDSDADLELLDPDEFGRLCLRHKRLRDELESIQLSFSQAGGKYL
jgi:RNA polymerase II elongation factor ELL